VDWTAKTNDIIAYAKFFWPTAGLPCQKTWPCPVMIVSYLTLASRHLCLFFCIRTRLRCCGLQWLWGLHCNTKLGVSVTSYGFWSAKML